MLPNCLLGLSPDQIHKKLEGGDVTNHDVKKFYSSVIAFYASAVTYILKWFPLDDAVVKDSEFVDFNKRSVISQWSALLLRDTQRF